MINITNKKECCGCTACYSICPKGAIEMKPDEEGFLYPIVNKGKCINCGLCNKICPIINKEKCDSTVEEAYSIRCHDEENLRNSTSGGFFKPFAQYFINNNGIVYGVGFDKDFNVIHKKVEKLEEVDELRGSKYVQSNLNNVFKEIKKYLDNNRLVLFSGTPCQVEGLIKYLRKPYDKLFTIDVICKGVPSQLLWKNYLKYQQEKYKSTISEVRFRNKTYGYHSGTMKLVFENGKVYLGSGRVDYMLKSYYSEIASRPSCYDCKFKSVNHISDITIYDCWNIEKLTKNIKDDDKGYTNIVIHSSKGKNYFELLKDKYVIYPVNINNQIKNDGIMVEHSAKKHVDRDIFYIDMNQSNIQNVVQKYIPVKKKDIFIEKTKKLLYKIGILRLLKRIKRK